MEGRRDSPTTTLGVLGASVLLSLFTVFLHLKALGRAYLLAYQVPRHEALLAGTAGNPWQYRVLSAWIVEGVHRLCGALSLSDPLVLAFVAVRVGQEVAMFLAAWWLWRALGLSTIACFLGLAAFGWSVSYSNYGSDLQFNTYFDVLFYLLAGLAVVRDRLAWLLPITALAALNRETSGLVPLLALAGLPGAVPEDRPRRIRFAVIGLAIWAAIFLGLRWAYGRQELIVPYGHRPGLDLLLYNLGRARTWVQLVGTFSILPFVAWSSRRHWPALLRGFVWIVVPLWFVVHWVGAVMSETRLLLVPMALAILPAALFALRGEAESEAARA
jgi:hypothetical protein